MTRSTPTSAHDIAALIELLEQQCQLYSQLAALSRRQTGAISADLSAAGPDADDACEQLLRLLAERQALIDQLAVVHERLAPYRADWPALWSALSARDRCRVGPLVSEVEQALAGIITQDERDRQRLEQARHRAGGELRRLATAGAALNAYKANAPAGHINRFTNQQG